MSQEGRNEVIKTMRVDVGFDFKEEDLPPKMRREITALAQEIGQIQHLRDSEEKARLDADRNKAIFYACLAGGFLSLLVVIVSIDSLLVAIVSKYHLTLTSVLLLSVGYYFNGLSLREKKKAMNYKIQSDRKWYDMYRKRQVLARKLT